MCCCCCCCALLILIIIIISLLPSSLRIWSCLSSGACMFFSAVSYQALSFPLPADRGRREGKDYHQAIGAKIEAHIMKKRRDTTVTGGTILPRRGGIIDHDAPQIPLAAGLRSQRWGIKLRLHDGRYQRDQRWKSHGIPKPRKYWFDGKQAVWCVDNFGNQLTWNKPWYNEILHWKRNKLFDNAEAYANGLAETMMGKVLQKVFKNMLHVTREDLVITTKIFFGVKRPSYHPNRVGLSRKMLSRVWSSSKRLQLDFVDVVLPIDGIPTPYGGNSKGL